MGKLVDKRLLVFLLSVGYLFVTLSHIPLIKRYDPLRANATNSFSIFKKQSVTNAIGSLKILFKRIDKHIPKKNKAIGQRMSNHSRLFSFLLTVPVHEVSYRPPVAVLNLSHSHLSVLCCFRL